VFEADNTQVIAAFRAGSGVLGGECQEPPLLLLRHRGAKSGAERLTPLLYWPVTDTSVAVLASNYGAPRHPAWYHNLLANPAATAEVGTPPGTSRPEKQRPTNASSSSTA
jgi:deazaflavin-dependent oxidoreductase (nitroreductase family)